MTTSEQLALFIDSAHGYALFVLDADGHVCCWNEGASRLLGYPEEEIVGRHVSCLYTPEDRAVDRPMRDLEEAASRGRSQSEGWRVRRDGSRFWAGVMLSVYRDAQGAPRGFGCVTQDLTWRLELEARRKRLAAEQQAREALALNERWLKTTLHSIGDAVIATDATGRVVFMNHVAEQLTGWSADEARGARLAQVFPILNEQSRAAVESPVERVLREGVVVGLANHTILLHRQGGEVPIDDSGAPIYDESGALVGVVLVFRDVSERRHAERALAKKHEMILQSLEETRKAREEAEAANDRLAFLAQASTVLNASLDYEQTLRNVASMVVPRLADWCNVEIVEGRELQPHNVAVAHIDPAKQLMAEDLRRRYPPELHSLRGIYAVVRSGQSERYPDIPDVLLREAARDEEHLELLRSLGMRSALLVPISAAGRVLGAITLVNAESSHQFTAADQALAEELGRRAGLAIENARIYRQVEELNRIKDDFLATLSHELRTPLTAILGWAQLLRKGRLSPEAADRALATIDRNARLQAQLINDVLDVSSIVAGKLQMVHRPVDLVEIVEAAVEALRPVAEAKGLSLTCRSEERAIVTLGDAARLLQIVSNLLSNAVKFTPAGGCIAIDLDRNEQQVRLRVRDTGVGIAPAFLPHLFERFRQADSSIQRVHGGLGIGLSIVRHLVEQHGGVIIAESQGEGLGATFTVLLPLRAAPAPAPSDEREKRSLSGLRILLVDDEADARALLTNILEGGGAEVRAVSSAPQALEQLSRWRPDLLVSDIGMPGMDGYALLEQIRAKEKKEGRRPLPAIALTAYAAHEDCERAMQAGYHRHIPKPVEPDTLVEIAAELARSQVAIHPRPITPL